jgi:hypothetical protein
MRFSNQFKTANQESILPVLRLQGHTDDSLRCAEADGLHVELLQRCGVADACVANQFKSLFDQ